MPTAAEHNGRGPSGPDLHSPPAAKPEPTPVTKGGPFDLSEIERLANEMFRAMPGAVLPGLDPDQLAPVPTPSEAEALRPPADALPSADSLANGLAALRELSDRADITSVPGDVTDVATPEGWSYLPPTQPGTPGTGPLPPSTGGGLFALTDDPIPLDELHLAGGSSAAQQDPFADSLYFLEETVRVTEARAQWQPVTTQSLVRVARGAHPAFDAHSLRRDFPVLDERVHGRSLVWLDNAATTQKPVAVIERLEQFYRHENSNVHRGAHELAARATDAYEEAREQAARFLHASSSDEIVFVRGTTEAINLVAQAWGAANVGPGDEILITWLEHHSNIVPWQLLCQATGARLCIAPVDDSGQVLLDEYERLLSDRTRLVAFSHVSNALGTITPVREMTELAHRRGARVLIDGAQAVPHMPIDVQLLDSDWYAFSGHKLFGPTGIGVLHGKHDLLNSMPPWQGGGNMIRDVTFERTLYQPAPARFEAGTPSIADAVALGAALDYVQRIGLENIARHEHELLAYATDKLAQIPGLQLIGSPADKTALVSFVLDGYTPEEVGEALNREGIAVRAGHHCAQPILRRFGHEGTVRASLAFYNTCEDIDALIATLRQLATRSSGLGRISHRSRPRDGAISARPGHAR